MNRLRGNTFLLLLLRAGSQTLLTPQDYGDSKNGVTKPNMLADLIKLTNPAYSPAKMDTLASYFSKYLAGNPPKSPTYLPFNNPTYQNGLNLRIQDEKEAVLHEMDLFCRKYLDLSQPSLKILVAGLVDVILEDDSFDGEFDIGEKTVNKAALNSVDSITLQNFLISVWNIILLHHPNTAEGADTYEAWTEEAGFNSPRTIVTDIGTDRSQYVEVVMDIEEPKMNRFESEEPMVEEIDTEEVTDDDIPKVEVYDAPFVDPTTQQQSVAHFNVIAKDNGIAIGQVFGGLTIGRRGNKDE